MLTLALALALTLALALALTLTLALTLGLALGLALARTSRLGLAREGGPLWEGGAWGEQREPG